ncbi:MAG: class I SAM-dependent methyltransferase [Pseudomonadota bacterium]|nr:class I SAM-dependent methyltransferase [Alphaproteobacteria bacterium]
MSSLFTLRGMMPDNYQNFTIAVESRALGNESRDPKIPTLALGGKIPTLNQAEYMTLESDKLSDEFIESAAKWGREGVPSVDVGAAYGIISLMALERGAILIANDVERRHLLILRKNASKRNLSRLFLNTRSFPEQTSFPPNSVGAILLRRVVHFLNPSQMELAMDKIVEWLKPGGSVFIVTMSPYHYSLKGFDTTYEERWENGNPWPGEIHNMRSYIPDCAKDIPDYLHVMDTRPLIQALEKRGMVIKQAYLFNYKRLKSRGEDVNGYCAIEAQKPM